MRGRTSPVSFTSRTLAERFASLGNDQIVALVFGREDHGLTREELMLCQTHRGHRHQRPLPVMNLAQSVGVFCYELSAIAPAAQAARDLPDAAAIDVFTSTRASCCSRSASSGRTIPTTSTRICETGVPRRARRARGQIVLGIIRQIEWKIRSLTESTASRASDSGNRR